jgi:hypothetical protein
MEVVLIIMFRYERGVGKSGIASGGEGLASLRPTMPLVALRVVLQEMAVGLRSPNPSAVPRRVQSERIYENYHSEIFGGPGFFTPARALLMRIYDFCRLDGIRERRDFVAVIL